jgi:hypothetical protein
VFEYRPELIPIFISDETGRWPFKGFRFLEGSVSLQPGADQFTPREIRCMTRAILGQSNPQIAEKIPKTVSQRALKQPRPEGIPRHVSLPTVKTDLKKVSQALGSPARTALLPRAIAHEVMAVEAYAPRYLFPASEADLELIGELGQGRQMPTIAKMRDLKDRTPIARRLGELFNNTGLHRGELLVAGAILTNQLDPITCTPIA